MTSFPGASYVRLGQLTPANLADLDVLVVDTVNPTPLTAAEQAALSGFVQDGGTVLAHVFSAGANLATATAVVAWRVCAALKRALVGEAALALEEELLAFAAALLALR